MTEEEAKKESKMTRITNSMQNELKMHWKTWKRPLKLYQVSAAFNRKITSLGYTTIEFVTKLDKQEKIIYLMSPLGKRYVFPMEALGDMNRDELLEEIRDLDSQELKRKEKK